MKDQIRQFILKAIKAADGEPLHGGSLRASIRAAFSAAMTEHDLTHHIRHCEEQGWIVGTEDAPHGVFFALTPKGNLKAASL